jgi:hypothetical protein
MEYELGDRSTMATAPILPKHQKYILQELEKLNISSLDLDKTSETRLEIRMHEIQNKLAGGGNLTVLDIVSLQNIIEKDRSISLKEQSIKELEIQKNKLKKLRAINQAAEADIQKFSEHYYAWEKLKGKGDWTKDAGTDDAIRNYLQRQILPLEVWNINEIPHQDAKFASIYATLASSALTSLFFYYTWRGDRYALPNAALFSIFTLGAEILLCDVALDAGFPTSKLAYYISSGIRIAVPTIVGGFILAEKINSFAESRTGLRPR